MQHWLPSQFDFAGGTAPLDGDVRVYALQLRYALTERLALKAWAWVAGRPWLYALGARLGVRYLNWLAGGSKTIGVLGIAPAWTDGRDFPAPQGRTFRELYAAGKR